MRGPGPGPPFNWRRPRPPRPRVPPSRRATPAPAHMPPPPPPTPHPTPPPPPRLGGVARDEVVHSLLGRQAGHGGQHAKGVAAQQDDVLWVRADARDAGVVNVLDRVGGARVFRHRVGLVVDLQEWGVERVGMGWAVFQTGSRQGRPASAAQARALPQPSPPHPTHPARASRECSSNTTFSSTAPNRMALWISGSAFLFRPMHLA